MSLFAAHRKQEGIGYVFHSIGDYVYHNFMRLPRSIIRYLILLKDILLPYFAAYHHHGYYPWVAAVIVSLLAYSYGFHVWILNFIIVVIGFAVGFLLVLLSGQHRPFKQFEGLQAVQKILTEKTELTVHRSYQSHKTVVSVNVDKAIQSIFDNLIRDYVLIWYQSINNDNAAFIDIISEQMWLVTENIVERLGNLDLVKLIYIDIVNKLCDHFKALRLSKLSSDPMIPFVLHPCLVSKQEELDYLRHMSEAVIVTLLPEKDCRCNDYRLILREVLACCVLYPIAENFCDPDYFNQTFLRQIEAREKMLETHKKRYAYAKSFEDFIKLITICDDIETLKEIRYKIIAEIMQSAVIKNLKKGGLEDVRTLGNIKKGLMLKSRNLKRYIKQCTYAKSVCERRICSLGGPDLRYFDHRTANQNKAPSNAFTFKQIMDSPVTRSYFNKYLEWESSSPMLKTWLAIENLKYVSQKDLLSNANDVYERFIISAASKQVRIDRTLIRGMEAFLTGNKGPDSFFAAQKQIYRSMEETFYKSFLLSEFYVSMVTEAEVTVDDAGIKFGSQSPINEQQDEYLDQQGWLEFDEDGIDRVGVEVIEEQNDSVVQMLDNLDTRIAEIAEELNSLRNLGLEDQEREEELAKEFDQYELERKQLATHIERTELWCDLMGQWRTSISNAHVVVEGDGYVPVYVILVERASSGREDSNDKETRTISDCWAVTRTLNEFQELHHTLTDCYPWLRKNFPILSKKWTKSIAQTTLDRIKGLLENYLQGLILHEKLCQSDVLYLFLCPSPDYIVKQCHQIRDRMSQRRGSNINPEDDDDASEFDDENRKDSIVEPTLKLINEIFQLHGAFKWLRRTLMAFVQLTFGGTINRQLRDIVNWMTGEEMSLFYLQTFRETFFKMSDSTTPTPKVRTEEERLKTRRLAEQKLMKNIPDVIVNIFGQHNSKLGAEQLFESLQDIRTNKHMYYSLLETFVFALFPEIKSNEVIQKLQPKKQASSGL